MKEALLELSKSVSNGQAAASCTCLIQGALWGGYDLKVGLGPHATKSGGYQFFSISKGKFVWVKPTDNDLFSDNILLTSKRQGTIIVASTDKAFAMGLPFFISEVQPKGPGSITFKVISNPKIQLERVFQRIEENAHGMHEEVVRVPEPFSSKPEPQVRQASFTPLRAEEEGEQLLSIVAPLGDSYCPVSNEINLRETAKGAAEAK